MFRVSYEQCFPFIYLGFNLVANILNGYTSMQNSNYKYFTQSTNNVTTMINRSQFISTKYMKTYNKEMVSKMLRKIFEKRFASWRAL
jgi:hypothetical protein